MAQVDRGGGGGAVDDAQVLVRFVTKLPQELRVPQTEVVRLKLCIGWGMALGYYARLTRRPDE